MNVETGRSKEDTGRKERKRMSAGYARPRSKGTLPGQVTHAFASRTLEAEADRSES